MAREVDMGVLKRVLKMKSDVSNIRRIGGISDYFGDKFFLSDSSCKVVMYSKDNERLEGAYWDHKVGIPFPDGSDFFDYGGIVPASPMRVCYFKGAVLLDPEKSSVEDVLKARRKQTGGFLDALIRYSEPYSCVEINRGYGSDLSCSFLMRGYKFKE